MPEIYIETLKESIDVSDGGRFNLPNHDYSSPELKRIAREVNKALREYTINQEISGQED